jgi:uncharacterized OB-fold protein
MGEEGSKLTIKALQCNTCQKLYTPPKYSCTICEKSGFSEVDLKGSGEIYSFTIIRMPFHEFIDEAPYAFAMVKLDSGLVVPGRFIDQEVKKLRIGARVSFARYHRGVYWFELV